MAPARFAPRLRCPLVSPPTMRSSIDELEEMEGGSASTTALDGYCAPGRWLHSTGELYNR
jgi:hypothetical protein